MRKTVTSDEGRGTRQKRERDWRNLFSLVTCHLSLVTCLILLTPPAWGAWGSVGTLGSATSKTSSTSLALTTSAQLDSGNVGVCVFASDNIGTADADNNDHTSVSDGTNTWTQAKEWTNAGAANSTATASIWYLKAPANLASGSTITFNLASAVTAKAAGCWEFTITSGNVLSVEGTNQLSQDGATACQYSINGLSNREHLYIGTTADEQDVNNVAITLNASFSLIVDVGTTGGGFASNMNSAGEYRIATLTDLTYGPSMDINMSQGDLICIGAAINEDAPGGGGAAPKVFRRIFKTENRPPSIMKRKRPPIYTLKPEKERLLWFH